jgi:predicted TIM-barrel fold metal-dependent hydrolase
VKELDHAHILDSQVHLWAEDSPARPWPAGRAAQAHRVPAVGADEMLEAMDRAGVTRAVVVPPSWEGDRNDVALAAAAAHPDRFAVMGRFPLEVRAAAHRLAVWRDQPGMLGVRITLHRAPWLDAFDAGEVDWFWGEAERAALPVMVYAPGRVRALGSLAARHPGLPLVVDHLAIPVGAAGDAAFAELDDVLALARHANVAVKASALPCHSLERYPFRDLHPHLRRVFDAFGPSRILFGSDYSRLPCSYEDAIRLFTEALDFLSPGDRSEIMGGAAMRWLRWPSKP